MQSRYYPPKLGATHFHCPYCFVYAEQRFYRLSIGNYSYDLDFVCTSTCVYCKKEAVWVNGNLVHPESNLVVPPHIDLPEELLVEYQEAASVYHMSPKAAAALLRLLLQKLLKILGGDGKNINADIALLVSQGLPEEVQMALDVCRLVGNNAVHPGEIRIDDNPEIVLALFNLINFVVEERISRPARIKQLFESMPAGALEGIMKRDQGS